MVSVAARVPNGSDLDLRACTFLDAIRNVSSRNRYLSYRSIISDSISNEITREVC